MLAFYYKTKKDLRASVGKTLNYGETSMFGEEWRANQWLTGVGPSEYKRVWYANVLTDADGVILKVK